MVMTSCLWYARSSVETSGRLSSTQFFSRQFTYTGNTFMESGKISWKRKIFTSDAGLHVSQKHRGCREGQWCPVHRLAHGAGTGTRGRGATHLQPHWSPCSPHPTARTAPALPLTGRMALPDSLALSWVSSPKRGVAAHGPQDLRGGVLLSSKRYSLVRHSVRPPYNIRHVC